MASSRQKEWEEGPQLQEGHGGCLLFQQLWCTNQLP